MIPKFDKGRKTSLVAIILLVIIIALFVALFLEIIDATQLTHAIEGIVASAVVVIGFLSKDFDQSHTIKKP